MSFSLRVKSHTPEIDNFALFPTKTRTWLAKIKSFPKTSLGNGIVEKECLVARAEFPGPRARFLRLIPIRTPGFAETSLFLQELQSWQVKRNTWKAPVALKSPGMWSQHINSCSFSSSEHSKMTAGLFLSSTALMTPYIYISRSLKCGQVSVTQNNESLGVCRGGTFNPLLTPPSCGFSRTSPLRLPLPVSCSESWPCCAKLLTRGKVPVALASQEKRQTISSSPLPWTSALGGVRRGSPAPGRKAGPGEVGSSTAHGFLLPWAHRCGAQLLLFNGVFQRRAHTVSCSLGRSETTPCWLGVETERKDLSEDRDISTLGQCDDPCGRLLRGAAGQGNFILLPGALCDTSALALPLHYLVWPRELRGGIMAEGRWWGDLLLTLRSSLASCLCDINELKSM